MHRHASHKPGASRPRAGAAALLIGLALLGPGQASAPRPGTAPDTGPPAGALRPATPEAVLFDAEAPEAERAESAATLVVAQRYDWLASALEHGAEPIAARLVLDALLTHHNGQAWPDGALRVLGAAALASPDEDAVRALEAIAGQRSRAAVRVALSLYTADRAPAVRVSALRTLIRQTGMAPLGDDPDAWRAWWTEVEWLTEAEWRARLASAHSARSLRLEQQRDALAARLVDATRRLHAALPPEQRSTLVAELIVDERVELRLLGLDLAQRAMLNARSLSDDALAAAIGRMRDGDERVRAQAALVVGRAAPANAGEAAAGALQEESASGAAAAQLAILARFPVPAAATESLRWLGSGPPAGGAAADALAALARAGMLDQFGVRSEALDRVREIDASGWTAAHVRLLDSIGEIADLTRLAAEGLASPAPEVRQATAGALARRPGWDDALAGALGADPALLAPIAQGFGARLAGREGLEALRQVAARAGAVEGLAEQEDAIIALMPPTEALDTIASIEDPARRLRLLESLGARPEPADASLIALARERLARGDGPGALAIAERLRDPSAPAARTALLLALAWSNDLDRAASLGAPAEAWLEAFDLASAAGLAHAPAIAARALALYGESLTPSDRERLERGAQGEGAEASGPAAAARPTTTKNSDGSGGI